MSTEFIAVITSTTSREEYRLKVLFSDNVYTYQPDKLICVNVQYIRRFNLLHVCYENRFIKIQTWG